ncbi:Rne/Rng family ribonuclease [Altererythrobacter soli]|uniref:Ribonuclease E n=1 Tax=Croceibacterium soli TaxID=1739690 RepID=A0A6I4UWW5_9SPHN|nr:ribonuclease E/G [Croceibacterium soli]MXP42394.1 Rne/Rng family ribonuclease [Croceibacterium soli]
MATRMLIDARHSEETRVAVLKGNRIEEFDFESADHKQIKGNIYLAKVTRVEPSLQAAFVDFGGNRHGFLAFSEIHPDYYQIPKEDREALLAEEEAHAEEEAALRADEDEEDGDHDHDDDDDAGIEEIDTSEKDDVATIEDGQFANGEDEDDHDGEAGAGDSESEDEETVVDEDGEPDQRRGRRGKGRRQGGGRNRAKAMDELRDKRMALRRRYKIQDVIQRRQVLLVQVVKEERGNKGAALTTYLSLAGRYCVLMPNSSHGGGISRKISSASDRKRLKSIVGELKLPRAMGLIVRTAGLQRTKTEIKRDFDYLARLWDEIRETTLKSSAPALIHSDSDLIKRAIRDIYNREIEEVVVEGADGFRSAKEFMKLLMPSHARRVKAYSDPVPLFQRYGAEDQLSAMYDPVVQLKSGGYLVINPTEALVSIDINSGRSTKEHGIEQTAVATNLEAAREIARQLRLRDMAGLVVIDFIDMEYGSNVRKVEKAMKDALKNDRARIQVGRISGFGLMEMSRQRLRTGVLEATTRQCPHCDGTGLVRTASSAGLSALRLIEDEAAKGKGTTITLYASTEAAIYLLNAKRADLAEIEARYGVSVEVVPEGENEGAKMRVASSGPRPTMTPKFEPIVVEDDDDLDLVEEDEIEEDEEEEEDRSDKRSGDRSERSEDSDDGRGGKRRRRRGGRGRNKMREVGEDRPLEEGEEPAEQLERAERPEREEAAEDGEERPRKRRRRGGRRRKRREGGDENAAGEGGEETGSDYDDQASDDLPVAAEEAPAFEAPEAEEAPPVEEKPKRRSRRKVAVEDATEAAPVAEDAPSQMAPAGEEAPVVEAEAKPKRRSRSKKATEEAPVEEAPAQEGSADPVTAEDPVPAKPKRTRRKKADAEAAEAEPAAVEAEAAPAEVAAPEAEPAPSAANDSETGEEAPAAEENTSGGKQRRGWWQRTFGE